MAALATITEKAFEWAFKHFTALNVCWLCVAITLGGGWFASSHFATAADHRQLRDIVTEIRADAIAKRIFDYKVQLCDTPPDQRQQKRWLNEQINEDVGKYRKITGEQFNMPDCADL